MALEADSWLCNSIFSYFQKAKNRSSLKTQFKIEFLLPFKGSRKVHEKMPAFMTNLIKVLSVKN